MKEVAAVLTSWGPFGLFFLAMLDSAGVPLPALVDVLVGATAAVNPAAAYFGAVLATLGSLIGCLILYYIGRKGGQAYLDRVTASRRTARLRAWFQTYGLISVFIPALVPIPLPVKVAVLSAGALGVSPPTFALVVLSARIPRYFGLAWLGSQLGDNADVWIKAHVWHLAAFAFVLTLLLAVLVKWNAQRRATDQRAR